jgi:hypothetical protein
MSRVEKAGEVGVDDLVPLLRRHLVEHGIARDARIVDKHLDWPELGFDLCYAFATGDIVGYVPFENRNAGHAVEGSRLLVIARITGSHLVAGILQRHGNGSANSTRSSRDQSHPAHVLLPSIFVSPFSTRRY